MSMIIKTLDEILADTRQSTSQSTQNATSKDTLAPLKSAQHQSFFKKTNPAEKRSAQTKSSTVKEEILAKLATTEAQSLYDTDRQKNYLRWLAFYYLSKRELSSYELSQKLKAKGFLESEILELLQEFQEKGYQSDYRYAQAVVREALRTGKGKRSIEQKFYQAKLDLALLDINLETLIHQTYDELSIKNIDEQATDIDWLKLAVEARTKKYGNYKPKDAKEKARQLRFLQYRGFEMAICFEALKRTLEDFE